MSLIEVEGLHKTFVRGFWRRKSVALRGVSFAVNPGEVFGFLGPNGAGKTTTMKILMGLIFPTAGRASLFGKPAGDREAKRRLGYLPEKPYFYDYLSVRELLDMVGRLHGIDGPARRNQADELIERVKLGHAADRSLRSYSKGMLQRAGLAQALMGRPELVILDEPMSGLDPIGRKEVRDLMLELRNAGTSVFFSTHILADATLVCERVGIIAGGKIRDVGLMGELLSPKVLSVAVLWEPTGEALFEGLPGSHAQSSEGVLSECASQDETDALLAKLTARGDHILSVTPHRQTLEELFVSDAAAAEREGSPS